MDDVLVIGEALVDIVSSAGAPPVEHPGGSPANVALGLARLDRSTSLLTRIGDDDRGRLISDHLEASSVRIVEGSRTSEATSSAAAVVDERGIASYTFDLNWSLPTQVDVSSAHALHTGSIAAFLPPGGDSVLDLVERSTGECLISYDPNARPQLMGDAEAARKRVERIVASAHVVKVSDEDVGWLVPDEDPLTVARRWQASGPALVVLTRGLAGATGVVDAGSVDVPAPRVQVQDTVGAGDAFTSGLLDALIRADLLRVDRVRNIRALEPDRLTEMLSYAVRVAAYTCTQAGAQPPRRAELDAWQP